jgi:hypothetical protein
MTPHDDLEDYLRGDTNLSRQYRRESAPAPPHALDRRVLGLSRGAQARSSNLAPLAFAASVLLSVALVLAIVFGPQTVKRPDDTPHLMKVAVHSDATPIAPLARQQRLYSSDPHLRAPAAWLADIAAMRRAGHDDEAAAEFRRFRSAYPEYSTAEIPIRP